MAPAGGGRKVSEGADNHPPGSLRHRRRFWLLIILTTYLLLTIGYGVVNPLFEAPDEHHHYFTAQLIKTSGKLPKVDDFTRDLIRQEAAQPPLYYLVAALILAPIKTAGAEDFLFPNPSVQLGAADALSNINAFVHTAVESWPWQEAVLAAHILRLFSALLGLGTLLCVYGSGRLVWPKIPERALLATAMVAFLPQFNFLHGSINNDTLIIFLAAAALWQLLSLWVNGITTSRLVLLGLTIGLAILSKMTGLILLMYAIGFLCLVAWREHGEGDRKQLLKSWLRLAVVASIALLLSSWLLWRNWQLYHDITATSVFIDFAGGDRNYTLSQVLKEWPAIWTSLFAVFGWFNIRAPQWVYAIWNALVLAAIIGVLIEFVRSYARRRKATSADLRSLTRNFSLSKLQNWPGLLPALLALWIFMVIAGLINFLFRTPAAQGRLLYPALVPLALGFSYGLSRYRWSGIYILAPTLALITSIYCLFVVIPNTYARPPIVTPAEIPADAAPLEVDLGQGLQLLAAQVETKEAQPGDPIWATLYWRNNAVDESVSQSNSPQFVLELFGQNDELAGKLQSFHGGGLFPANLWPAGAIVADQVAVRTEEHISMPVQLRLNVKIAGESQSSDIGTVKIAPDDWPALTDKVLAQLNGIELVSTNLDRTAAAPGDTVNIRVRWQVTTAPENDFTTFVHLGDPLEPPLVQGDNQPLMGHYPTILWSTGEVIDDSYTLTLPLDIPAGVYPIHIGMYDSDDGVRLPLSIAGDRQLNDALLVGHLTVPE